jgi:hypothetical protein
MFPGYKMTIAAALLATVSSVDVKEKLEKRGILGRMMGNNMMGNNMMGNNMMGNNMMGNPESSMTGNQGRSMMGNAAIQAHYARKIRMSRSVQMPQPSPMGDPCSPCGNQGNSQESGAFTQSTD